MIYHGGSDIYALDDLGETVEQVIEGLRPHRSEFDSVVVTGMSGVIVGAPAALGLNKPLVVLRKPNDGSHHGNVYSDDGVFINVGQLGKRALFLDDFVSGGETRARVQRAVEKAGGRVTSQYTYREQLFQELGGGGTAPRRAARPTYAEIPF